MLSRAAEVRCWGQIGGRGCAVVADCDDEHDASRGGRRACSVAEVAGVQRAVDAARLRAQRNDGGGEQSSDQSTVALDVTGASECAGSATLARGEGSGAHLERRSSREHTASAVISSGGRGCCEASSGSASEGGRSRAARGPGRRDGGRSSGRRARDASLDRTPQRALRAARWRARARCRDSRRSTAAQAAAGSAEGPRRLHEPWPGLQSIQQALASRSGMRVECASAFSRASRP